MYLTHGNSYHPLFGTWQLMRYRCANKKSPKYGGRGIKVCKRWKGRNGFVNFVNDMGPRPKGKTLDRFPNNNGNYEPSNCRWATLKQQNCNTRRTKIVIWKGKKYALARLIRKLNKEGYEVNYKKVWNRLLRGWTLKQAVTIKGYMRVMSS